MIYNSEKEKCITLVVHHKDINVLEYIKKCLKTDRPVSIIRNDYRGLYLSSKLISENLSNLGCVQAKTFKLKFPDFLSEELMSHFIRGYFDGDGSAYQSNRTEKHKQNFSEAWKKQWETLSKEEQLLRIQNWIEAGHESLKDGSYLKPSSIEVKVKKQLDMINIRYAQQKRVHNGSRYFFLDFYLPDLKLVIECNGDYWHNLPDKIKRYKQLKKYVESTGRKIIFIWEHEINDDWFWIGDFIEEVMQNA